MPNLLEKTFCQIHLQAELFREFLGQLPTKLYINPDLLIALATHGNLWERPELRVLAYGTAPLVTKFYIEGGVLDIIRDNRERLFRLE